MLPTTWQEIILSAWAFATLSLAVVYVFIVVKYRSNWQTTPDWAAPPNYVPKIKISVIIPARNEAEKLPACLNSIATQTYPASLFEVFVLDDESEDNTLSLAQNIAKSHTNVHVVCLEEDGKTASTSSHKKKAIETGVGLANGELIVCTDADCIVPPDWLKLLASFYEEKKAKFIAAPVNFHHEKTALERFQSLDFLGMMGVTGAGFQSKSGLICNGANLAYPKAVFHEVGGFEGINGMASGDDVLLLHKIAKKYPNNVFFLKNRMATVLTEAQPNLRSFLSQRLRWASKSRSYTDHQVTFRLVVVFLLSWAILLNALLACWFGPYLVVLSTGLFFAKTVVDFAFLKEMSSYFGRQDLMRRYLLSQMMHIAYIIGVGTLANVTRRYDWKGRQVR